MTKSKSTTKKILLFISSSYKLFGILLCTLATILVLFSIYPIILYRFFPKFAIEKETERLTESFKRIPDSTTKYDNTTTCKTPPLDDSLPKENRIIIRAVGIDTKINEGNNYKKNLKTGAVILANYGTPTNQSKPIIIAGHRYKMDNQALLNQHIKSTTFFTLSQTQPGDIIEIIWHQRKFKYIITEKNIAKKIKNNHSNLVVYTCQDYLATNHIFVYANRSNTCNW